MNQKLAKSVYIWLQKIRHEDIEDILKKLEDTQWLSTDELKALQWQRFKKLIHHAYKVIPFYQKRFKEIGIEPGDINSQEDLKAIPTLNKSIVKENFSDMLSPRSGRVEEFSTSGSTGEPLKLLRDPGSLGYHHANMYRLRGWYDSEIGGFEATFRLFNYPFWDRVKTRFKDALLNRIRINEAGLKSEDLGRFCQKVIASKPEVFYGFPSLLVRFTQYLMENGYEGSMFPIKVIVATSEMLYPGQKKVLEEFFNVPVVNEYGCTETGIIAIECPEGGWHIPAESCLVEVEQNGEVIAGTNAGKIIVTDLWNYAMPFIRYEIGDLADVISSGCSCGRGLPVIDGVVGRAGNILELPDGRAVHSFIFHNILKKADVHSNGGIREFQIRYKPPGDFHILVVPDKGYTDETTEFILHKLKDALGEMCKFEIEKTGKIIQDKPGKMEKFIILSEDDRKK